MKTKWLPFIPLLLAAPVSQALATEFKVEITNLTNANYFTPLIVSSHSRSVDMFELAEPATAALQAIAEGGDVSAMQTALEQSGADVAIADTPTGAPVLAPGETASATVDSNRLNRRLSLAAMILPTNDAFVGLDSINLRYVFSKTYFLYGYDAGTEANNELLNVPGGGAPGVLGIPGDPSGLSGSGGTGVATADTNTTVHIHRGIIGDSDLFGGASDLDSSAHRWQNPVAKVVITRLHNY